jgi:hypothetical protein
MDSAPKVVLSSPALKGSSDRLPVTVACALVFGIALPDLFPHLHSQIHDDVLRRVSELYDELQGNPAKETRIKLDFLETVLTRLEVNRNDV